MKRFLVLTLLLISGCTGDVVHQTPFEATKEPKVYFCPKDNCTARLVELIEQFASADCALYNLQSKEIIEALGKKQSRLIIDDIYANKKLNLNYISDDGKQITHNKFCVFDARTVWTGSFNPTEEVDNNNVVVIQSRYLAANYEQEFDEMWNRVFGGGKKTENPMIVINGKMVENYFCPEDSCKAHVLENLARAKSSIRFMVFSLTDKEIAQMIVEKSRNGLRVQGIMEKQRINMKYEQYKYLNSSGVEVKPDKNKHLMHNKVFIIDNETVITGSYNPTQSGNERNDENILIIHDREIAKQYVEEFERLW
ncbi:MAG: phospholipase D-like domain-containing protein [Candidatus Woesearchaeota archaeon]